MLTFNVDQRISAAKAFKHPWLNRQEFNQFDQETASEIIGNMGRFCVKLKRYYI